MLVSIHIMSRVMSNDSSLAFAPMFVDDILSKGWWNFIFIPQTQVNNQYLWKRPDNLGCKSSTISHRDIGGQGRRGKGWHRHEFIFRYTNIFFQISHVKISSTHASDSSVSEIWASDFHHQMRQWCPWRGKFPQNPWYVRQFEGTFRGVYFFF